MSQSPCDVCTGTGKNMFNEICPYCNGTGEWNDAAAAYLKNHICQCIAWDRKNCPICKKECHHTSQQTPKQTIDPGFGGQSTAKTIFTNKGTNGDFADNNTSDTEQEMMIVA